MARSTKESQLRAAAANSDLEAIKRLLDDGVDIHSRSGESGVYLGGNTALDIAVKMNQPLAVELLLKRGADPNQLDGDMGYYPLSRAIRAGYMEVFALLLLYGARPTNVEWAGYTALHHCALFGRLKMTKILVEGGYGVDINAKGKRCSTPLAMTSVPNLVNQARTRVARYLRDKGAVE